MGTATRLAVIGADRLGDGGEAVGFELAGEVALDAVDQARTVVDQRRVQLHQGRAGARGATRTLEEAQPGGRVGQNGRLLTSPPDRGARRAAGSAVCAVFISLGRRARWG